MHSGLPISTREHFISTFGGVLVRTWSQMYSLECRIAIVNVFFCVRKKLKFFVKNVILGETLRLRPFFEVRFWVFFQVLKNRRFFSHGIAKSQRFLRDAAADTCWNRWKTLFWTGFGAFFAFLRTVGALPDPQNAQIDPPGGRRPQIPISRSGEDDFQKK